MATSNPIQKVDIYFGKIRRIQIRRRCSKLSRHPTSSNSNHSVHDWCLLPICSCTYWALEGEARDHRRSKDCFHRNRHWVVWALDKWFFLSLVTCGIYIFWVGPQIQKWKWEHLAFT